MTSIMYEWAAHVLGKPLNPDGRYGNQCVDTIDHFAEWIFGVPWPQSVGGVNGARDLLNVAPDEYWERIDYYHGFVPQQFDVLVFDGDSLNQFGHTAVNWWANSISMDVIQQDGFAYPWQFVDGNWYSAKPAHYYTLSYSQRGTGPLAGVLRPRASKLVQSGNLTPAGTVKEGDLELSNSQFEALVALIKGIDQEGATGQREAGPLYDLEQNVLFIRAALTEGVYGQRTAGLVPAMLAKIQGQNAGILEALKQANTTPGQPINMELVHAAAKAGAEEGTAEALAQLQAIATTTVALTQGETE